MPDRPPSKIDVQWPRRDVWDRSDGTAKRRDLRAHIVILDGTMSSLERGFETHAGQTYKILSETGQYASLFYEPGLQWNDWQGTYNVMTGRGLSDQIRRAYGHLASRYKPGDDIYFFGYSRGAYAVRSLAGMIDQVGLLRAENAIERNVRQAFRHYRHGHGTDAATSFRESLCHEKAPIEMVGVWDTVRALGLRLPILWRFTSEHHAYHNHELGSSIRHGFHALAYDERRRAYEPVLWDVPAGHGSKIDQVWFIGTHGDVGGQIGGRQDTRPLANISLTWMLARAETCGLQLPDTWRARFASDASAPSMGRWAGWSKLFWLRSQRKVLEDRSERLHQTLVDRLKKYGALPKNLVEARQR